MSIIPEDRLFSLPETCVRLGGLSRAKVYNLIRSGELAAVKVGTRTFVRQSEIERFLDSLPAFEVTA